jgi:glycosyltransferase involved in cell wall biosynthesis
MLKSTVALAGGYPDRKLRVAILGDYPISEGAIHEGGVQSVTHSLAHALARRDDIECHLVSAMRGATTDYRRAGNLHVHYVRRLPLPRLLTCKIHDIPALVRVIGAIKPDVVHGQGQDRHGLAALRSGYPAVVTSHGVTFVESKFLKRHRLDLVGDMKMRMLIGWEREVFARAKEMIVISSYLSQIYGPMLRARTTLIDNPINPGFFALARAPVPGRLLFVGTVVPRKCVHDLVQAFSLLRQRSSQCSGPDQAWRSGLQLRIAGPLSHSPTEQLLRRLISELGLDQQVTLLGAVSEVDLMDEYSRAQLLLIGSREETAPQAIAQAMACGLPAVASAVGGVSAMIKDGVGGLLFPFGDAERCSNQILRLLQDETLREDIALHIRKEGRARFHPDAVAHKTVDVYHRAISLSAK